jgi:hypothetical protein
MRVARAIAIAVASVAGSRAGVMHRPQASNVFFTRPTIASPQDGKGHADACPVKQPRNY